jgi:uncharacterized RDD family membrane protein YckC
MKCPKCQYLGFETGDRCRNCGYDFSLIEFRAPDEHVSSSRQGSGTRPPSPESWDGFKTDVATAAPRDIVLHDPGVATAATDTALPLFALSADDQPLVRLPPTPRRPLSVRRTPENPRLRATPREVPVPEPDMRLVTEPELDFPEEATVTPIDLTSALPAAVREPPLHRLPSPTALLTSSSPRRRCIAACIDYALLFGIDTAIVYFTVRMAGLDMSDWRLLPVVPLALFLGVIALAYVGVFTALGGQTIGKMAARIRVVADDAVPVTAGLAFTRTAAVVVSWLTGGLGFLPALVGEHRALHDRLSRTRVVDLA